MYSLSSGFCVKCTFLDCRFLFQVHPFIFLVHLSNGTIFSVFCSMPEEEEYQVKGGEEVRGGEGEGGEHIWSPVPVNTHLLLRQARNLYRTSSVADLRLTEADIKSRR